MTRNLLKFVRHPVISEIPAWISTKQELYLGISNSQGTKTKRQRGSLAREKAQLTMRAELSPDQVALLSTNQASKKRWTEIFKTWKTQSNLEFQSSKTMPQTEGEIKTSAHKSKLGQLV